jgi:hypothetical protein
MSVFALAYLDTTKLERFAMLVHINAQLVQLPLFVTFALTIQRVILLKIVLVLLDSMMQAQLSVQNAHLFA